MITYVVYIENANENLGDYEFLLQAYVDKGLVGVSQWEDDETDKLRNSIQFFLSRYINREWQLIVVDGSELHNSRNPYKNSELHEKITQLLDGGEKRLPTPERIYLLSQRGELEPICMAQEVAWYDVPFNLLKEYESMYRFLVVDILERESIECSMFRLMCGALIVIANKWAHEVIERNYLYILSWDIDDQEAETYLEKRQCELQVIGEILRNELLSSEQDEGESSLPVFQNYMVNLEKTEGLSKFTRKPLRFWADSKEHEVYLWKLKNHGPLDGLESLMKVPVRRWEREIIESKNNMLEDLRAIDNQKIALNASAINELKERMEKVAEDIFSTELKGKEQKKAIRKIKQDVEHMEKLIITRMTKISFLKSMVEAVGGLIVIFFACLGLGGIEEQNAMSFSYFLFLLMASGVMGIHFFLGQHRNIVMIKLNRTIEKINETLSNDNILYNFLIGKIILYKKYSMLNQQQKNIQNMLQQRRDVVIRHLQKLLMSEVHARLLVIVMGKKPNVGSVYSIAGINWEKNPEECGYYYFPYDLEMTEEVMVKTGIKTLLPFPFIKCFKVKRECPDKLLKLRGTDRDEYTDDYWYG